MTPHLELHDVGVLAALAEVQELAAQHRLAVLAPRDEPAWQQEAAARQAWDCCTRGSSTARVTAQWTLLMWHAETLAHAYALDGNALTRLLVLRQLHKPRGAPAKAKS